MLNATSLTEEQRNAIIAGASALSVPPAGTNVAAAASAAAVPAATAAAAVVAAAAIAAAIAANAPLTHRTVVLPLLALQVLHMMGGGAPPPK